MDASPGMVRPSSLIATTISAILLVAASVTTAAAAGPPYAPGETLNPTCIPGNINCIVDLSLVPTSTAVQFAADHFIATSTTKINVFPNIIGTNATITNLYVAGSVTGVV